ncbi:GPR1/FUN34/yaaH family-domain-containing protein [Microdochium bolleyi]|uniref:GPR1/FUN34/yaaH family-domain-containing protein n=1 Tax=Microdochium bolleyi TaxID=196109 RepID=A0A136ITD4_9PEZI|nr:GPR1/FUN34/yaaH family-domain-containing protein [Microdochium bolleyi]
MTVQRDADVALRGAHLADPAPLAMGGFATTLLTVSLAMMNLRGVSSQTLFVGNLCFVACVGLLISAQWSMVKGDTFSYTVLSAYGLFYGGYGAIMIPSLGIVDAYGGYTPEFYNAFGFYLLLWGVFNLLFLVASTRFNLVYVGIFVALEFCLVLDGVSHFLKANGQIDTFMHMQKAAGAFAFVASILGYYTAAHYFCEDAIGFALPMGTLGGRGGGGSSKKRRNSD